MFQEILPMRFFFAVLLFIPTLVFSQSQTDLGSLSPQSDYDNISTQKLNADSGVTSFVIWIKKEVRPHRHAFHTEQVYVLEGTGKMLLGKKTIEIKAGDLIFIPNNTVHALRVTSAVPVKVLSIQAPEFDGSDRIPVDISW
jgi:mannose-6-phosphate isomerase-like protein (cupin superfamily)